MAEGTALGRVSRRAILRLAGSGTLALVTARSVNARTDPSGEDEFSTRTEEVIVALDRFLNTYNAGDRYGDWTEHKQLLLFPQIRMSNSEVSILGDANSASGETLALCRETRADGYGDAYWNFRDIVQVGSDRAHVATAMSRITNSGSLSATYGYLFILESHDRTWKVRGTSSYSR